MLTRAARRKLNTEEQELEVQIKKYKRTRSKSKTIVNKNDSLNENLDKYKSNEIVDENHPLIHFKYNLKTILTYSNHNIEKWFNLNYIPKCLLNIDECISKHASFKNSMKLNSDLNYMLRFHLNNNNYLGACMYLQFCLTQKRKIPNEIILGEFLRLILDVNDLDEDSSFNQFILETIEDCFNTLFTHYPSHIYYMRQYYRKLSTNPVSNITHKDHENYESFNGYFYYCLNRLESELLNIRKDQTESIKKDDLSDECVQISFNLDRGKSVQNYDDLAINEKILRLYLLMKIMGNLFEDDLVFRALVYNKEKKISHNSIISHVIWGRDNMLSTGFMKPCIRKIIRILILSIRNGQKKSDQMTIVKLLGIIAHAMHLTSENRKHLFLDINNMQINFLSIEISTMIQAEDASTVISFLSILQPCFLKYLVSNKMLNIVHDISINTSGIFNMTFIDIFEKRLWLNFANEYMEVDDECNIDCSSNQADVLQLRCDDYVKILYEAFNSFGEMFELNSIKIKNVKDILSIFCNEKPKNLTSEENQKLERNFFKKHYHIKNNSQYNLINAIALCGGQNHHVMNITKGNTITQFVQKFSYLPAISWTTGYSYYKKCILYIKVVELIQKLKIEDSERFKIFKIKLLENN